MMTTPTLSSPRFSARPEHATLELDQLGRGDLAEAVNGGVAVADLHDRADVGDGQFLAEAGDLLSDNVANLG
jgi:hypothetical protein